jgi:PAS domain S-box-containing protein
MPSVNAVANTVWGLMGGKPRTNDQRTSPGREDDQVPAYLAALAALSDSAMIGTSLDGTISFWNAAAERLYGYSADEALGRSDSLIVPPDGRDDVPDLLERIPHGERSLHHCAQHLRKDGALILVSLSVSPVLDANGTAFGAATVARGMVEDRGDGAGEAARYARSLIEASINPLVATDPRGKISDVNIATEQATGVARDQLIGTDFADCFTEPEKARTAYHRVLQEGLLSDYPLVLRHVSGTLTEVEYNATVYRDESGELRAVFAAARNATEARKARLEVARLAAIAASSQYAMFSRDLEGTITSWNAAAEALYGYSAAEAIGRNGAVLIPPGREAETQELIKCMLRGERSFGLETQRLRKDGSLLDVALTISPVRDAAGDIRALSVIGHDISERKRVEASLREREADLARSQAIAHLGSWSWDIPTDHVTWSDETYRIYGVDPADFDGRMASVIELIHPDDRGMGHEVLAAVLRGKDVEAFENRIRRPSGEERLVMVRSAAVERDAAGEPTRFFGVVMDVTERTQAAEALRQSEAQLRTLIDTLPDLVWLKSPEGVYLSCNRRFESFFGAAEKEIVGRTDYDFTDRELADFFRRHDKAAMAAGDPTANEEEIVFAEDGHKEVLETIKTPVRASDGRLIGVLGVGRDITERKRTEEKVSHQAEQLRRTVEGAVRAMSHMVESRDPYTAGHERRVAELAAAIGEKMGMAGEELDALRLAGTIHDVGKIAVPAEILAKPGVLSPAEFSLIKGHPSTGFDILADVDFGSPVAEMVLQHHERLDGSGYPRGLVGQNVLPEARILAVADVVEAMSSHRPYRAALGMDAALAEIREHAGVKYDAEVVMACARLFEEQGFEFTP